MRAAVALGGLLVGLGCAGLPTGSEVTAPDPSPAPKAPRDNASACSAWVSHHNDLACLGDKKLDEATICAGASKNPHDLVRYYGCLVDHARCDGDTPDFDIASCRLPR